MWECEGRLRGVTREGTCERGAVDEMRIESKVAGLTRSREDGRYPRLPNLPVLLITMRDYPLHQQSRQEKENRAYKRADFTWNGSVELSYLSVSLDKR